MKCIGIDIGLKGAIACVSDGEVMVWETPLVDKEMDIAGIRDILFSLKDGQAFVEKAQAMPKQGVVSMFNYGKSFGIILGILTSFMIPYTLVTPQAWKKEMLAGMGKEKSDAIIRCQQLFPQIRLKRTEHGKAEALLIAQYGLQRLRNNGG